MQTVPYGGEVVRNLIYHVYPVKGNDVWRWNVGQLLPRMGQFTGQRIVSVVTDETTDTLDAVKAAFRGTVTDFLHFPNNPKLGEVVSFPELLRRVEHLDPRHVTFYGHAKGVHHEPAREKMTRRWAQVMYSNCLDYPAVVEDALSSHTLAGTFLKEDVPFENLPPTFHYAGTFYWFRNASVFSRSQWRNVSRQYWGTEAWPGVVCPRSEAACLLMTSQKSPGELYFPKFWQERGDATWRDWQIAHATLRRHQSYREVLNALRQTGAAQVVVTGPQRSGTMIAADMLAQDLGLPFVNEREGLHFDPNDFGSFHRALTGRPRFVVQAPTMSAYAHLLPYPIVFMRRALADIVRSQRRIGWEQYERAEKNRYFDHTSRSSAVVKAEAWEKFQRIQLGERAFDLDYESMRGHPLWVDPEARKGFDCHQTRPRPGPHPPRPGPCSPAPCPPHR